MKTVCAWCATEIEERQYAGDDVAHALCATCASNRKGVTYRSIKAHIDEIDIPVFVVGSDITIAGANTKALTMLKKKVHEIRGRRGGEVFECVHSFKPGGCGNQPGCAGCVLRRTVVEAFVSGNSRFDVPATQTIRAPDGSDIAMQYLISAVRLEEYVMLRVEKAGSVPA